jgi:protein-S-isoprenylcysteine O-methyltransferase Ste14
MDERGLRWRALLGLLNVQVVVALLLFVSAGTVRYWEAWLYWALFSATVLAITLHLLKRDPALLGRRLRAGPAAERERSQQVIQAVAGLLWCALYVVPGIERRLHCLVVPPPVVIAADVLAVAGLAIVHRVFLENSYASGSIEVASGQRVVSTGPYARVRHPMYSGAALMLLATPPALGSLRALPCAILLCVVVAVRALDEERYLSANLPGYDEYRRRVRYRLIPHVW